MHGGKFASGPTWRFIARTGAVAGVGLTFAYALVFALYATLQSSLTIWATTPTEVGRAATLAANGASILVASLAMALLLSTGAALLGSSTAVAINWLLNLLNTAGAPRRAIVIGLATALGVILLYHLALQVALGQPLFSLGVETYLFWFGLPGLIHLGAGAIGARRLNLRRTAGMAVTA
jgi:hypothetical protein